MLKDKKFCIVCFGPLLLVSGFSSSWSSRIELWSSSKLKYTYQAFRKGFSVRACNIQRGISGASDIESRWFKIPNSSTHSGLQLLWRVQGQKRSFSTRKLWCEMEGKICFLIWWETDSIGSPIKYRKSDGSGEILSTTSNLLYFSIYILSLRLLSEVKKKREESHRGHSFFPLFLLVVILWGWAADPSVQFKGNRVHLLYWLWEEKLLL